MARKPSYRLEVNYHPYSDETENKINKLVGKLSDDSGYGPTGRDMGWEFHTRPAADKAKAKIDKANIRGCTCEVICVKKRTDYFA